MDSVPEPPKDRPRSKKLWFPAEHDAVADSSFLEGRSGPADRPLMAVTEERLTTLSWHRWPREGEQLELTLAIAIDYRDFPERELLVTCGEERRTVGKLEIIYPDPYQILSIPLRRDLIPNADTLTLHLRLTTGRRVWLFAPDPSAAGGLEYHVPHLHTPLQAPDDFRDRLCSLASLQAFGWKEGCVLEGIHALGAADLFPGASEVLLRHLDEFGFSTGHLVYESPRSETILDRLTTIESTLPFAQAARLDPRHPWIDIAIGFWQEQLDRRGQVYEHDMISSEGAYTVAYPMTLIAYARGEERWAGVANDLLIQTFRHLVKEDGIYLRHFSDGRRSHRNWARGLAWLLLGHVETLRHQPVPTPQIIDQLLYLAEFSCRYQREDGLWSTFVDDSEIKPDTSGSAGIAAAFVLATNAGWLPASYRARAHHCRETLNHSLTSEGFLGGSSQSNKADEELQRRPYRVSLPYALGLLGTLEAALAGR